MEPTDIQLKNRERFTQGLDPISPEDLQNNREVVDFNTREDPTPFNIDDLQVPDVPLTDPQKDVQKGGDRVIDINDQLKDLAGFEIQKEEEFGVSDIDKSRRDTASLIKGFQLKSQDLANQKTLAEERIQQESIGRGRTRAGVAPLTASAIRKITLEQADIASQALTASASLNAIDGNLASARAQVADAVKAKFGPLLAEKAILLENLDIIINSPEFSKADKDQALKRKLIEQRENDQIEADRDEQEEIWGIALDVAPVLSQLPTGSAILTQINQSGSKEEALRIATEAGAFAEVKDTEIDVVDTSISDTVANVLDGFQSIDELTPTQQQKVRNELRKIGLFDAKAPDWFTELLQESRQQNILPEEVQRLWVEVSPLAQQFPDKIPQIIEAISGGFSAQEIEVFLTEE